MSTLYVGSSQTYQTIADAVAAAQAGDTIIVKGSEYTSTTEEVVINKSLTLQAEGDVTVNYIALGDDSNTYASPIDISVSGFTIKPTVACDSGRYRGIWQRSQGVKSVAIADCNIDLTDVAGENSGILMSYSGTCAMEEISITDCTITGNTVDGTTRNGIYIGDKASLSSMTITGNTVSGTFRDAIGADFSRLSGSTEYTVNISNNNISDSQRDGIQFGGVVSTGATIIANDNTISNVNNAQCGSDDGAIAFHSGSTTAGSVTISGNNISDAQVGVAFCNMASTATTVTNNTIAYTEKNTGDDNVTAAGITGYTVAETDNNTVMELASADNIIVDADITGNAGDIFEYNGKAYVIGTNAFTTIEAAVAAAADGATVLITAGEYSEVINYASKGNKNNVTITGETDAEGNSLVNWTGSLTLNKDGATWKDITLSNINFINTTGSGACVSLKECYRWTFENCSFDSTAHNGAYGWNPISFPSGANGNNGHTISNCSLTGGSISVRVGNDATAGYGLKVVGCTILNTNFNIQAGGTYDVIFENNDITIEYDDATLAARAEKDNAFIVTKSDVTTANIIITGGTLSMVGDQVPVTDKGWTAVGLYKDFAGTVNISGVTIKNETENSFVSNFSNTASSVTANVDASGNTFVDANDNVVADADTIANEILNLKNGNVAVDYSNYSATTESAAAGNYNGHKVVVYTEGGVVCAFVDGVAVDASKLYVNSAWSGKQNGEIVGDSHIYGYNAFSSFADAAAKIKTDGSNTTIKILNDQNLDSSIVFDYGTGNVLFTADSAVTIKQNKNGLDLAFTKSVATNVIIDKNVTFEISDNSAGIYLYYGPCLTVNGTITGGANWGCLYLFNGSHNVSDSGTVSVGRIQVGYATLSVGGDTATTRTDAHIDTNYLLIEGGTFNAKNAIIDANVIYDNNNGGQRWGASEFNINNSKVTTSKLTLSYADSVMNVTGASDLVIDTLTGNGKINFTDAALDADTVINTDKTGSSVGNAMVFRGDNTVSGSKIYTGWNKNLNVGDWNGADASASLTVTDGAELIVGGAAYIGTDAEDKGASANKVTVAGATFAGHGGDGSLYLRRDGELEVKDNALASFSYVRLKGAANVSNADFEAININFSGALNADKANITVSGNITDGTGAITLSNGSVLSVSDIIFGTALNIDLATPIKFDHTQAQIFVANAGGTNNVFTQSLKAGQTSINLFTNLPLGSYTVTIWAQEADNTKTEVYSGIPADITTHGSLSMDFTSQLKFSGDLNVPQGSITIDTAAYTTGTYKLIDYTGSDIASRGEAYYTDILGSSAWHDKYIVVNGDLYLTDLPASPVYLNSAYTSEAAVGSHILNYNAFGTATGAFSSGADKIVVESDINELLLTDYEFIINKDTTISSSVDGEERLISLYNNGTTYDIVIDGDQSNSVRETLTIDKNVTLEVADRIIWAGYYGNDVDITVDGTLKGGYQLWIGADTTVSATGKLVSAGEAFVLRRGAVVTLNGNAAQGAAAADRTASLEANYTSLLAGEIIANDTLIKSGMISASNSGGYASEGSIHVELDNTIWNSTGNLQLGSDALFEVNNGSILNVALHDGYGASSIGATSSLWIDGGTVNASTMNVSGEIDIYNGKLNIADGKTLTINEGGNVYVRGTSELHIDTLTGTVDIEDGATVKNSYIGGAVAVDGGEVAFDGANTVASIDAKNGAIVNINAGDSLNVTGSRTKLYNETINITGEIADALTADKSALAASLKMKGMSLAGYAVENDTTVATLNVTNAYVDLSAGDLSSKPDANGSGVANTDAASGTYNLNFTNSILDVKKVSIENQSKAKFDIDIDGSVVNASSNFVMADKDSEMTLTNGSVVNINSSFKSDGTINILSGSKLIANNVIQPSENAGMYGTVNVDNAELTLLSSGNAAGHAVVNEGNINLTNSAKAKVNFINNSGTVNVTGSTFTATGKVTNSGTVNVTGADAFVNANSVAGTGKMVMTDVTVDDRWNISGTQKEWQFLGDNTISKEVDLNGSVYFGTLIAGEPIADADKALVEASVNTISADVNFDMARVGASMYDVVDGKYAELNINNNAVANIGYMQIRESGKVNITDGATVISNASSTNLKGILNIDGGTYNSVGGSVAKNAVITISNYGQWIDDPGNGSMDFAAGAKIQLSNNAFFSTTSWYGSAEITMDHTSKIVVNVPQQTNIAITVDTTGYTGGTYLIADFNKAGQFNTTSANTLVFNNDLYVTDQDNSILYVNNTYTGSVGDITADGKIIGYNAFANIDTALTSAVDGSTVMLKSNAGVNDPAATDDFRDTWYGVYVKGNVILDSENSDYVINMGKNHSIEVWSDEVASKLTIAENVKMEYASQVRAWEGGEIEINGKVGTFQLWAGGRGGKVTINSTADVDLGYGDGMIKIRNGGTIVVNGDLSSTSGDRSAMEQQLSGGYISVDNGTSDNGLGDHLTLNNTYVSTAWLVDERSAGAFNFKMDNSIFEAGKLTLAANGVADIENNSIVDINGAVANSGEINVAGSTFTANSVDNSGTISVSGISTLNIATLTGENVKFLDGAVIKDSTIGGNVFVAGNVTFRGDNTFAMLYDFGTLTDYYGTTAPMKWTVERGASLTLTTAARYGLGYGDDITILGNITDAKTARESLTDDDLSFFTHGLVAQESSGWNCDSKFTVKDAYVEIGSNNSFGNKPGNYGGTYTFNFENAVVTSSRITFYEALSTTSFTFKNSDVKTGTFMTRDKNSTFTLDNTKLLSATTTNGNDEGNYNAGKLNLINGSELTYSAQVKNEDANAEINITGSTLTLPSLVNVGKVNVENGVLNGGTVSNSGTIDVKGKSKLLIDAMTGTIEAANGATIYDSSITGTGDYASVEKADGYKYVLAADGVLNFEGTNFIQSVEAGAGDTVNVTDEITFGADGFKLGDGAVWNIEDATVNSSYGLSLDGNDLTDDGNDPVSTMNVKNSTFNMAQISAKGDSSATANYNIGYGTFNVNFEGSTVNLSNRLQIQAQESANVNINFTGDSEVSALHFINYSSKGAVTFDDSKATFTQNFGNAGTVNILNGATVNATYGTSGLGMSGEKPNGNSGTINVTGSTFALTGGSAFANTGAISVTNSTFNVTGTLTNSGSITIDAASTLTADAIVMADGATITINADGYTGLKLLIDQTNGTSLEGKVVLNGTGVSAIYNEEGDVFITDASADVIYVNSAWSSYSIGEKFTFDGKELIYSFNAFDNVKAAVNKANELSGGTVNLLDTPYAYAAPLTSDANALTITNAGNYTITGGNGALLNYEWEINPDKLAGDYNVTIDDAFVTLTKFTLRDNADVTVTDSRLDFNPFLSGSWFSVYRDSKLTVNNSTIGYNPSKTGVADPDDFLAGNPTADSNSYKWSWGTVLQVYGDAEFTNSTLFLTDNEGGHSNFSVKGNGNVTFTNSYISNALFNVGFGGVDSKYFGSGDDINDLNAKLTISGSTIRNTQYRGDNASSGIRVGEGDRAGTLVITNSDIDMTVVKYTDGNEYGLTVYNGSVTVTNSKVSVSKFANSGTVSLTGSTLTTGAVTNSGNINIGVADGKLSVFSGTTLTNSGTITIDVTGYTGGEYKVIDLNQTGALSGIKLVDNDGRTSAGYNKKYVLRYAADGDVYVSTRPTTLYVNSDYNSSTDGYGYDKFNNYQSALNFAIASGDTQFAATIVIEKTTTISGNCIDQSTHKNLSNLDVVIQDGATMGNANSKWDMTYAVTIEGGGILQSARPKSAGVGYAHLENALVIGEEGSTKKAYLHFLSDAYQDIDISIRYNGSLTAYNADITVQDLDAQGSMTLNDSTVYVEGALATASWYKTTLTNTTMTVGGTLISGGISDFAGGTANQLGRVTMTDSSITFGNDSTVNVKDSVSMTDSDIVADIFNVGNTLTLTESTLDVGALTITSAGKLTMDIESTVAFKTYSGSKKITVSNISSFNSGAYKLLDYTGSGSYDEAGYRNVINWNDNFTVFNNDLYLTDLDNSILYVNGAYSGNVGDTVNGKIIGYNAFENLGDALKNADGKTVMVETADRTLEGVTAWDDMSTAYTGDFTLDAANDPTDVKFYKNNLFVGDITFNENVNIVLTSGAKLAFGDRSNVDAANAHTYTVNGTIITDGGNTAYVYVRNHRETVNLNGKIDIAFCGNGQVYNKGTMTVTGTGKGYGADNYQLKSDYMLISGVNDNGVRLGGVLNLVDTAVKVGTLQLSNGDDELYSAITATNSTLDIGAFRYGNGNITLTGSVLNYTNTPVQASENHGLSANGTLDLVNSTMNVTNGAFQNAGKVTLTGNAALNGDIELNGTAARLNFGTDEAAYTGSAFTNAINGNEGSINLVSGTLTMSGDINAKNTDLTIGKLSAVDTTTATLTLKDNTVAVDGLHIGAPQNVFEEETDLRGRHYLIIDGATVTSRCGGQDFSVRNTGKLDIINGGSLTTNGTSTNKGDILVSGNNSAFTSTYTFTVYGEVNILATLTAENGASLNFNSFTIGHSSNASRAGFVTIDNATAEIASLKINANEVNGVSSGMKLLNGAQLTAGTITNAGTVEMDYTSKLTFSDTITVADGASFTIDLTDYTSGIYKVIDYTGSATDVDYSFVNGGNMNNLVSVGGDLYVYNGNADTIYVNAAYDYETAKADGLLYGYNAAGSFESALEFAIGNGSSRIELMGDINDAAVVNPGVTHNIAAGQNLTIGTVSGATATVDINRGAGKTYSIYQRTNNSSLTIEAGVTLKGLDVIACGFFTSGNFLTIDGRIEALSLKEWTSNGGITINETGSVWLGYGDGQLDLAYGNGYLTVNGTLTDTSDAALGEAQLKAGYSGTRGNGNKLNLNNTFMEAGAKFTVEGSNGTFNIKNSVLKVSGGDFAGSLSIASSGNVFDLTENSRLVVANVTVGANNTIKATDSSLELKTLTNSGTVNVTNGVITANSVINNDKFYVNDTIFTATSMTNNTGDFIINGGTVAIGTLTNPASGRTKVTGETLIKIDNLSGANSMWLMDDAVLLEDSAIYGLTVRAVGDTVTFGKADNGSDGTITVTEFDNRIGYTWDSSVSSYVGSQAGQELVINDTMNVTGTWLCIFGATDGTTVVNGNGKIVANNTNAIFQKGKTELNVDVETGRHLRFTNTDITITGTVSATVPDSVVDGQLTALQNANVTVDGGTIDTAHHLLIGYHTYIGNDSVSDAYKSTLTLKNGGVVETDYNLYLNKASKIVANNGTLTVGGNAYTYAESEIALTNSTFTAGSVTNKGKISVEGATFTANSVENSGDFYITGTSTINAELASGDFIVYSADLSGSIENNATLYLTDTTFKANVTGKGNFYVYGDTEIDGDISVEAGCLNVYNDATLNIASGNKFTFTGNTARSDVYRFVFAGGNLDLDGELNVVNSATRFSRANVNVADTAVVNAEQHICIYNSDVTINGEFNVTGMSGRGEGIIIGHNSYDYAIGTASVKVSGSSAKLSVADCGTTVALRVYSHANGSGSLTVEDGAEVNIGGIVDNSGTITVDNANFSARKIVNSGDIYLTNAVFKANVTGAGNFIVSGNVAIDSVYSVENGFLTVNQDSALTVAGSAEFATVENNGTITVDWTASFAFANIINNGTFTVDLTGYKGDAEGKVVLDHATGWTAEQYKALLGDSWNDAYFTVNADGDLVLNGGVVTTVYINSNYSATGTNDGHTWGVDAFNNHADALAKKPQNIIVYDGTFNTSSGYNGSTAVIESGSFKNVYAGGADGSVVSDSTSLTIKAGSFNNVYGGSNINTPLTVNQVSSTELNILDGKFSGGYVIGGDYVKDGVVIRESSNLTISGGTFSKNVAGGMMLNTSASSRIAYVSVEDINFTISGGSFATRVYGGNFALKVEMSHDTVVTGDINLVIDATQNNIAFGEHIVAGSYGYGKVEGDVTVTFSKAADKTISFAADSIVLGGSGNAYTMVESDGTRTPYSFVYGERTVAFDNYSGDFGAAIKMFSDIDVTGNSNVNFTSSFSFADISDWDIEFGSSLSGIASNDFTGDTIDLDLTGFDGNDWTVMVGTENALSSFDSATLTFSGAGADQWIASGYGLKLEDTDDGSAKRLVFGQLA